MLFMKLVKKLNRNCTTRTGIVLKERDPNEIDFYKYGVNTLFWRTPILMKIGRILNSIYAPLKSEDLAQWMNFVFEKTPAEIQEISR